MKLIAFVLASTIVLGCSSSAPMAPSGDLSSIDTSAVQRLLDDAIAEAERMAETASLELPAALAETLEQNGIEVPEAPANAAEICAALGTPGVGTTAAAALRALIDSFVAGGEVGLAIGLLTTVVFTTCPIWSPHLETAVDQLI